MKALRCAEIAPHILLYLLRGRHNVCALSELPEGHCPKSTS